MAFISTIKDFYRIIHSISDFLDMPCIPQGDKESLGLMKVIQSVKIGISAIHDVEGIGHVAAGSEKTEVSAMPLKGGLEWQNAVTVSVE